MPRESFSLSSQDCELLLAIENAASLSDLSRVFGKDVSVLSRQARRISEAAPVLEKIQGRWQLTETGRRLNRWTLESMAQQGALLRSRALLRIGATRTFATKVLASKLDALRGCAPGATISLHAIESGVERSLAHGEIDIGFACGKPDSPDVAFRRSALESYVLAASPRFLKQYKVRDVEGLMKAPHLMLSLPKEAYPFLEITERAKSVAAIFNDIPCTIEAAVAHHGWGIFPLYAIAAEVDAEELVVIPGAEVARETYGVWWLKERKTLVPYVAKCLALLETTRLNASASR